MVYFGAGQKRLDFGKNQISYKPKICQKPGWKHEKSDFILAENPPKTRLKT